MKKASVLTCTLLILTFLNSSAQELLVPLDREGKITTLIGTTARKLELFNEFDNVLEARLYKAGADMYFLEILYLSDNYPKKDRLQLNEFKVNELRKIVTDAIYEKDISLYLNQEGRPQFLATTAILSLSIWGPSVPILLELNKFSDVVGTWLIFSGVGFLIPYSICANSDITDGIANFASGGGILGTGHGALLSLLIGGKEVSLQGIYTGMLIGSLTELITNYHIAKKNNFSGGKSNVILLYSTVGSIYGIYFAGAVDFLKGFPKKFDAQATAVTVLLTSALGYTLGANIANSQNYTEGDVSFKLNSWIIGTLLPASLLVLGDNKSPEVYCSLMSLGGVAGLILGNELVKGYDFSKSDGIYNTLATFSGGLLGTGLGSILSSDVDSFPEKIKYAPLFAVIGGGLGYFLTYFVATKTADFETKVSNFNIEINPSALLIGNLAKTNEPMHLPLINFRYRF